jgi:hypothetical protein
MNEAKEEAKRKAQSIDSQKASKNKMGLGGTLSKVKKKKETY